jgi:hypothetical protein
MANEELLVSLDRTQLLAEKVQIPPSNIIPLITCKVPANHAFSPPIHWMRRPICIAFDASLPTGQGLRSSGPWTSSRASAQASRSPGERVWRRWSAGPI